MLSTETKSACEIYLACINLTLVFIKGWEKLYAKEPSSEEAHTVPARPMPTPSNNEPFYDIEEKEPSRPVYLGLLCICLIKVSTLILHFIASSKLSK
jgi:hypothetical protein